MEFVVFEDMIRVNSISDLESVEKLKGYKAYYKIRFGSYRMGFEIKNDTIILERVMHRKDIYRYFP